MRTLPVACNRASWRATASTIAVTFAACRWDGRSTSRSLRSQGAIAPWGPSCVSWFAGATSVNSLPREPPVAGPWHGKPAGLIRDHGDSGHTPDNRPGLHHLKTSVHWPRSPGSAPPGYTGVRPRYHPLLAIATRHWRGRAAHGPAARRTGQHRSGRLDTSCGRRWDGYAHGSLVERRQPPGARVILVFRIRPLHLAVPAPGSGAGVRFPPGFPAKWEHHPGGRTDLPPSHPGSSGRRAIRRTAGSTYRATWWNA